MSEITLVDGDTVCIPHGFELCRAGGYGGGSRGGFIYSVKAKETPKDDDEIYDHEAHCNRILARMPESTRLAIVQSTMVIFSECRRSKRSTKPLLRASRRI